MADIKILWADDEIDMLKPQLFFLEKKGYQVVTVTNGHDALEVFEEEKDIQGHLTKLENILIDIATLNDPVTKKDKNGVLIWSLPEAFSFMALMPEANNME